ncbi:GumC family protein [Cyclobacterium xiamenense]|uniref:GumC family protein n=1 Tax=Cyclobacterium xiamenense TaxID=1297121 RepID=UPI0035D066A4
MQAHEHIPNEHKNESTDELRGLLVRLIRFWPILMVCASVGIGSAHLFNRYLVDIYQVETSVIVSDKSDNLSGEVLQLGSLFGSPIKLDNEISILKSLSLAKEAVRAMNVPLRFFQKGRLKMVDIYPLEPFQVNINQQKTKRVAGAFEIRIVDNTSFLIRRYEAKSLFAFIFSIGEKEFSEAKFGAELEMGELVFSLNYSGGMAGQTYVFSLESETSLSNSLRGSLAVNLASPGGSVLLVSLKHENVQFGIDYLNQLVESYLDRELRLKNLASENTIDFIEQQLRSISDTLAVYEGKLEDFRTSNQVYDLSQEGSSIFNRLVSLDEQLEQLRQEIVFFKRISDYMDRDYSEKYWFPALDFTSERTLSDLVGKLASAQEELAEASANYSPDNPSLMLIRREVKTLKNAIDENLTNNIEGREVRIVGLQDRVALLEEELGKLPATERELLGLQRQFTINENVYLFLLQKSAEVEIAKASNAPSNLVLDEAIVSGSVYPNRSRNLVFGLMLGLFIPVAFISLRFFLSTKIEDPSELQNLLSSDLIGMIGRSGNEDPLPVFKQSKSGIAEAFRNLRSDLVYLSPGKTNYCLLFTSGVSGEGKTFVSGNMAGIFALAGKKTLLMGMDLRKPKIAGIFNLVNDVGLSTCLSSSLNWRRAVKPSGFRTSGYLTFGANSPKSGGIIATGKT